MRRASAIITAGIAATLVATAAAGLNGRAAPRTQLVLLGTGTPNADPERFGAAVAIVVDDVPYLVDFGPGVVRTKVLLVDCQSPAIKGLGFGRAAGRLIEQSQVGQGGGD